jgi:hypothetical protein
MFPGQMSGPVEVSASGDVIAAQRILAGPSFEEVPGYPQAVMASSYHWTWYDMQSAGVADWILIANPGSTDVTYQVEIAGAVQPCGDCIIPAHDKVKPVYPGQMSGPVSVTASGPVVASQRVMWNGYFNETLGTVLD